MSEDIKKTFEEIKSTFEELKKADKAKDQDLEKKGVELGEHKQKIDRISEHLDKLQEKVEKAEVEAKRKPIGNEEVMHFESRKNYVRKLAEAVKTGSKMDAEGRELQEKAFFDYYRAQKENAHLNDAEIKSMSVISDPNGGYTVMPDTSGRITQRIYETSPLRQVASVTTIGTDALEGFFDDNEASAGWVGEVESRSETNTPEIGKYRIPVEEMYAKPKVSQKLLEDSMWNIENFLVGKVANKFSRLENTSFITGTGINQPMGILSYTAATAAGTYERNKIGQVASGVSGSLNMDSIISLQETL
ncbi:phage major capsid protein, partial [Candidatus Woesearchaeota archaeon]|nr:phage major capsid protein [Candidatus Woesearchaeota archaeon]